MSYLCGKKILLGITGSIAAYKAAELVSLLKKQGAEVQVVMTEGACQFIAPLTLQALSSHPVHVELLNPESEASMSHISLARWADLLLIAPASADFMAKMVCGVANDLLSTLYLACNAPVALAPAMNQQMWLHCAVQDNKARLIERGVLMWGPGIGTQACGETGPGRMVEPEELLHHLDSFFAPKMLAGFRLLITAGPTREPIDPVRYIGNYSSGKMGYALAETAVQLGAKVTLISGPTHLTPPPGVEIRWVETASEMRCEVMGQLAQVDIFIASAAVADYRCQQIASNKIKKEQGIPVISLVKNHDILLEVGQLDNPPFLVGFAAETTDLLKNANQKLQQKKLDVIIANEVGGAEAGFQVDNNEVYLITANQQTHFPLQSKAALAKQLLPSILSCYQTKKVKQTITHSESNSV